MNPSRAKHRSAVLGAAAGTVAGVAVVAAGGWFALNHLPTFGSGDGPTASASPSPTVLAVTWNPLPDGQEAMKGFTFPACGEEYGPQAQAVNGITPKPSATFEGSGVEEFAIISPGFETDDGEPGFVLGGGSMYVITLDDKVVRTSQEIDANLDLFTVNNPTPGNEYGGMGFSRSGMCDVDDKREAFEETLEEPDWAVATEEEINAYNKAWEDFEESLGTFPAGTYRVYQISPIVFGEQLALAEVFSSEGLTGLSQLQYDLSYTNLAQDPRVSPYCMGDWNAGDWHCEPPPDVVKEVLTREIDPSTVDDTTSGIGISEPLEQVVD